MADYGASSAEPEKTEPDLDELERVDRVYKRWRDARDGLSMWRTEARESYDFDALQQWSDDDIALLSEQERPNVTFSRGSVIIDAICGLEVTSRQQVTYFPREQGDVQLSEVETAAAHWVDEQCHGEDEDSEAFRDACICGIGATEMKMSYDDDPDGMIVKERRDPMKVFYDPASNKKCLEDARYFFYADWMDNKDIENAWPDKYSSTTPWDRIDEAQRPQNADLQFLYKDTDGDFEKHKNQSLVVQYQCMWREPYYRVLDPATGQLVSIESAKFSKIRAAYKESTGQDLQFVKQMKPVYYRGFYCGRTELEWKKSPYQEGFTFKFITFKRDRNRRIWYGVWRAMKDPQRWANKWLSQILHIINTNAKGGAFAETNAIKDWRKAEDQWAASNPLIELNEGGIDKIRERVPAQTPTGLDKLMTFAFESLPFVTGVNLEALGLANRDQAGVLEAQRRKAAYGILAPLFDALRLYRKQQGKMLLYFIREFISDGRLIRVIGEGGQKKYVPLIRRPGTVEYDLIVDQAPNSPDFREKTWEAMKEILPIMMKEGIPIPPSVFDFAPIPSNVSQEFKQLMANRSQIPPQVQQQMQQMQEALQKSGEEINSLRMENSGLKVGAQVDILKVHAKHAEAQDKNQVKVFQTQMQSAVERANALLDAHVKEVTSHLDRKSEEMKHFTQLIADFKKEVLKQSKGEGSGGTIVVDAASAIVRPVAQLLTKMEGSLARVDEGMKSMNATQAELRKPRKKTARAVRNADGSYSIQSEEQQA
jgi:hypothetical protein